MKTGYFLGSLVLGLLLAACSELAGPPADVAGVWRDTEAQFVTCGQTRPVDISLELTQTGDELRGTFMLSKANYPFVGTSTENGVSGEVRDSNQTAFLLAELSLRDGTLTGAFTATETVECTGGGTSTTVYRVDLVKR